MKTGEKTLQASLTQRRAPSVGEGSPRTNAGENRTGIYFERYQFRARFRTDRRFDNHLRRIAITAAGNDDLSGKGKAIQYAVTGIIII